MLNFIKQEKFKVLATLIVAGFFLYFWVNGPIVKAEEVALEEHASPYSAPKMVEDDPVVSEDSAQSGGLIGSDSVNHSGNGIIGSGPKQPSGGLIDNDSTPKSGGLITETPDDGSYGIIVSETQSAEEFGKRARDMRTHAKEILGDSGDVASYGDIVYLNVDQLIYLESKNIITDIHGYAGPVNVGVVLDKKGSIHSVHHISSEETKSYLEKIRRRDYYKSFESMPIQGQHEVDAVSGATLTSQAIASTVSELVNHVRPEPLATLADVPETGEVQIRAELSLWWILHITVILILFLYGIQKKWRKTKRGVMIISLLSVAYIGFFLNNSFTYVSFLHPFLGTSVSSLVGLYALLTLLGAIWGKNTYCKYVCPFGNVQRLIMKFGPNKKKKFFLPNKWIKRVRGGIAVALIVGILLGLRNWSNFELFPDLFGFQYLSAWFFIAVATVALTSIYPMIWCRLLCPTGSILDFISDAVNYKRKKSSAGATRIK